MFLRGYYQRLFYRPCCNYCKYSTIFRVSDITLADAWHIEELYPQLNSLQGVSLILFNSSNGCNLLNSIKEKMTCYEVPVEFAMIKNEQLNRPTNFHVNRDKFFILNQKKTFHYAVKRITKKNILKSIMRKVKQIIKSNKNKKL